MIFQTYLESWNPNHLNTLESMKITDQTVVTIAFGSFNFDAQGNIGGMTLTKEELQHIISIVKIRGGKTILSFGGATYHLSASSVWPDYNQIADRIVGIIDSYGFDGCDLDIEEQQIDLSFADKVMAVIKEIRAKKPHAFLSLTIPGQGWNTYWQPLAIAAQDYVDTINFMEYDIWVDNNYVDRIKDDIASKYIKDWGIHSGKLSLGLMPGSDDSQKVLTVEAVKELAIWARENNLNGIMIWDANRDYKGINGSPSFAFTNTILENI